MYNACISCSNALGGNHVLDSLPVGSAVAFNPGVGRAWVICPHCGRWNLLPFDERWEALEEMEQVYQRGRVREQGDGIGLAVWGRFRLVRIGDAPTGELASWRYGRRLARRRLINTRRDHLGGLLIVAPVVAGSAAVPFLPMGLPLAWLLPAAAGAGLALSVPARWRWRRGALRPLLIAGDAAAEGGIVVRQVDTLAGRLEPGQGTEVAAVLESDPLDSIRRKVRWNTGVRLLERPLRFEGELARRLLSRMVLSTNRHGATEAEVDAAMVEVSRAGGGAEYVRKMAKSRAGMGSTARSRPPGAARLPTPIESLALEMSLHEDLERAALQNDLRRLKKAWVEAEAIARIADAL